MPSHKSDKSLNLKKIISFLGLIMHVPGIMAIFSIIVALLTGEVYAAIPFLVTGVGAIGLGQLIFHVFREDGQPSLWDSMALAALSWFVCPIIAAVPFYWICTLRHVAGIQGESVLALMHPVNAIFEAFSGFTGTGLTLVKAPDEFSSSILWWRSLTQWIGGVGLIVFIISVMNTSRNRYHLYYAEARTEALGETLKETTKTIWLLYIAYTVLSIILFFAAGMPLWQAINHGMTGIATGGFTITNASFGDYSIAIKVAALFVMFAGSVSFVIHYQVLRLAHFTMFWKSKPTRFMIIAFLVCSFVVICMDQLTHRRWGVIDSMFMWMSATTTTGFSVRDVSLHAPMLKIFFVVGMIVGGSAGSTSGGIKVQRFLNLYSSFKIRLKSILDLRTEKSLGTGKGQPADPSEEPGVILPDAEQTRKLFASGVLFFLWVLTVLFGWLILTMFLPEGEAMNAFFEVVSASSNVGLSTNIISPDLNRYSMWLFIILMWAGRVEIIPAIVLFISFFRGAKRTKK